ncbi:MAG: hypothetical protein O7H41_04045 [Planctomycetota bacterium]|nr:hypothetical protein [Planctomycetota bacterium]
MRDPKELLRLTKEFRKLEAKKWTQRRIAEKYEISQTDVCMILSLWNMPKKLKDVMLSGELAPRSAMDLSRKTKKMQAKVLKRLENMRKKNEKNKKKERVTQREIADGLEYAHLSKDLLPEGFIGKRRADGVELTVRITCEKGDIKALERYPSVFRKEWSKVVEAVRIAWGGS